MDELLSRQMPHSLEAEQAVLGSLLIDADCIKDVMDKLQPEDFYIRQNREIFETIYTMFSYSKPVDGVTVAEEMQKNGTYDELTTRNYLVQLMEVTPTSANVMEYVAIVRSKALLRSLAKAAGDVLAMVQEGTGEAQSVLEAAEQRIYAIRRGRAAQDMVPIGQIIKPVLDQLNELAAGKTGLPGLSSGFSAVDQKLHGLNRSDLILLAARPGMGKTSFALNIALNVAKSTHKTVAVFSLEMPAEQLAMRMLCTEAKVDMQRVRRGQISDEEWGKLSEAMIAIGPSGMFVDASSGVTVAEVRSKARRLQLEQGLDLIMIDYIQLMTASGRFGSRQEEVSAISRSLKGLATELGVPVIALSQLSRAPTGRANHRPMLSDIRESGAIEQDADVVMFIHREDYYEPETAEKNIAEIIIAKQRNGALGTVKLGWKGEYTWFMDLSPRAREAAAPAQA